MMVGVGSRKVKQLNKGERSRFNPAWSPDGRTVACISAAGEDLENSSFEIVYVDVFTGKTSNGPSGQGFRYRPQWSPDGATLAYLAAETIVNAPKLFVVDPKDGAGPRRVPFVDRGIKDYQWANDGKSFLMWYRDGPSERLGRADLRLPGVRDVTSRSNFPIGVFGFSQSRTGLIAWYQYDPQDFLTVKYVQFDGFNSPRSEPTNLLRFNLELDELALGRVEIVKWNDRRGNEVEGSWLLPPQFHTGKKYPLIVDTYPRARGIDWTNPMGGNFAWASMGYVVFRPSPPAPHSSVAPWTTQASSLETGGAIGIKLMVNHVLSGVDELIRRGIVDSDRMCLYGYSNGGGVVSNL